MAVVTVEGLLIPVAPVEGVSYVLRSRKRPGMIAIA